MSMIRERLARCFSAVFPQLSQEETVTANADTVPSWDSSNHFLLMQVIEEEFSLQIPEEVLGELVSFAGFEEYLEQVSQKS